MWKRISGVLVLILVLCAVIWWLTAPDVPQEAEVDVVGEEMWDVRSEHRTKDVPAAMMELYRKGPHALIPAEIVKSLTPKQIGPVQNPETRWLNDSLNEHCHSIIFDVPSIIPTEDLHSAQLRLTLSFTDWNLQPTTGFECLVTVYWDSIAEPLSQQVYFKGYEVGIHFNCTEALALFHENNQKEGGVLKMIISIRTAKGENVQLSIYGSAVDSKPLLLLLYTPKVKGMDTQVSYDQRKKRDIDQDDYEEETNNLWSMKAIPQTVNKPVKRLRSFCRRKPLYVDFSEIQYDSWIVAPNGYQAFQCSGRCGYPLSDHLSPTKHAIVQTLLHSISPMKAVRSCCVPTRLDSISVLYLDLQGVLTYRFSYKDMVVAECGCR